MLREIVEEIKIKWEGGPDDYKSAREIEKLIWSYDFFTAYIESNVQKKKADEKNKFYVSELKKLGVTSFTKGKYTKEVK